MPVRAFVLTPIWASLNVALLLSTTQQPLQKTLLPVAAHLLAYHTHFKIGYQTKKIVYFLFSVGRKNECSIPKAYHSDVILQTQSGPETPPSPSQHQGSEDTKSR
jgi:hypothetical protein